MTQQITAAQQKINEAYMHVEHLKKMCFYDFKKAVPYMSGRYRRHIRAVIVKENHSLVLTFSPTKGRYLYQRL